MSQHKRWNPLNLTARQVQNLMALVGLGLVIFMVITRYPIDPIYAGLISALLFGQKLIPWGGSDEENRQSNQGGVEMAEKPPRSSELPRRDGPDVGSHLRDVRYWASC